MRERAHLHHIERLTHAARPLLPADPVLAQAVGDILRHRHVGEERVVLEHGVDVAPVGRQVGHVFAADADGAGIRQLEAADHPQHGRLSGARGAQQRDETARLDLERDIVDRLEVTEEFGDRCSSTLPAMAAAEPASFRPLDRAADLAPAFTRSFLQPDQSAAAAFSLVSIWMRRS